MRNGFYGWVGFGATESPMQSVLAEMGCGTTPDSQWIGNSSALATASRIDRVELAVVGEAIAAVAGAPRLVDPELAASAESDGMARVLAGAYLDRGPELLLSLRGGFALSILRPDADELLLAVDRSGGRHPLSYKVAGGGCIVFGSSGDSVENHPRGRSTLDPQGIFNYLYYHVVPAPRTVRRDVHRLLPGCYLRRCGERVEVQSYWEPEYREREITPLRELEQEFHELLRNGVRHVAEGAEVGCFLSGGTDSSAVAGTLREILGRPVKTYSIGFEAQGYDEMEYARTAARHFETDHREYYLTPDDVVDTIPRIAQTHSEPFGNESAVPTYHCARLAREDGVERLLAGDGGDELFAGNPPCAKQKVFGLYERIPAALRRTLLEPMVFGFPGGEQLYPVRKARSYIRQANVPMPQRAQSYVYIERLGAATMIHPEFLATVDPQEPLRLLNESYHGARAESMLNRMLAMSLRFTLADNDLPKVSRMCELAGIDVRYPMLDDSMVSFSCKVPSRTKLQRGELRWFYKYAMRGILPDRILNKDKHGFGLPFGIWLRDFKPLKELAYDSITSLKSRGYFQSDFLDYAVKMHQGMHAAYYGELIWILMMLELWLQSHSASARWAT